MNNTSYEMKLTAGFLVAALLGSAIAIFPKEWVAPFIILGIGGLLIAGAIFLFVPAEDKTYFFHIFSMGVILRVLVSVALYFVSWYTNKRLAMKGFFLPDGATYSDNGFKIAQLWARGQPVDEEVLVRLSQSGTMGNYDYLNAIIYSLTGKSPLSIFFINSLLGVATVLFVYLLARKVFNRDVARIASGFAMFWPSLILWSTQNLKEPIFNFLIAGLVYSVISLIKGFRVSYLGIAMLSMWGLLQIRAHAGFLFLLVAVPLSLLLYITARQRDWFSRIFVLGAGFCLILVFLNMFAAHIKEVIGKHILDRDVKYFRDIFVYMSEGRQARGSEAMSSFLMASDISSLPKLIVYIPLGFFVSLLAPFPWQFGGYNQILAFPETIIYYILLPSLVKGVITSVRRKTIGAYLLVIYIIASLASLGLMEGNIGSLHRHRSFVLYYIFMFYGVALAAGNKKIGADNMTKREGE